MHISRCWGTDRVGNKPEERKKKKKKEREKKKKEIGKDRNVNRNQGNSEEYFQKIEEI